MIKLPWSGRKKIGLALSGGVARSLAHIGVLKVLKKEKIPVDLIAGTSGGAMIGAFFSFGIDPSYIEEIFSKKNFSLFKASMDQINPFSENVIEQLLEREIGNPAFEEANIPFAVIAQDLKTGETVEINSGSVLPAVAASCAFPGVFRPKIIGRRSLIDGGGADNLPVSTLIKMKADICIAVDVVPDKPLKKDTSNPVQVMGRAIDLAIKKLSAEARAKADLLIEPDISPEIWHTDFDKAPILVRAGEKAALEKVREIKQKI